ncbi:glycerophosphoryl diester phosphodiesterase [Reyranella soli]|uniref:Glycerophosphoryl diester phosphodiesterase n=2 Tax=Reyranella soli TaxID=1230389 RepID=A0A512NA18_9HYPH|nr:glycerophosphoryl diester phosphodiesterase [Reyranella soli]
MFMVLIIGHRGARNLWPENSLQGFKRTRDLGVDAVEFDVHLSRDGELVVIHDPSLERTTEGTGPVAERTARDLDAMGVPGLKAVLDVYAGTPIELHIEIKTDVLGRPYEGLEKRLLDVIGRRKLEHQAVVTSFVPEILETVRRLSPQQRVLASLDRRSAELFGGLPSALDRLAVIGNCMVAVEKGLLADSLDLCLRRVGGEFLGAWVPNDDADIADWLARPIRQITTDRPDVALALRR